MRIGIDIDGVLTDVIRYACDYGSKYFFDKYGKLDINIDSWSLKDMFNVSDEEDKECWLKIVDNYAINESARPFAAEIIDKIKNENNEIYIITARSASKWDDVNGEMNNILISWLNNNNIKYDKLIVSKEKLEICKNYKIDIMIEDKTENTEENVPSTIMDNINKEIENATDEVKANVIDHTTITIVNIGSGIVIFLAVRVILVLISLFAKILTDLPVIKQVDKLGGLAYGAIEGIVIVYAVLAVISLTSVIWANNAVVTAIAKSSLGEMLYNNNIILNLLFK